jgi:hypothetical protein
MRLLFLLFCFAACKSEESLPSQPDIIQINDTLDISVEGLETVMPVMPSPAVFETVVCQHGNYRLHTLDTDPYIHWGTPCTYLTEHWLDFARLFIRSNSILLEINPSFGWSFIPLVDLIPAGVTIALGKPDINFEILRRNIEIYGLWNRTLLISQSPDLDMCFPSITIADNILHTVMSQCIDFIYLTSLKEDDLPIHEFIANSFPVFLRCSTVLYLEINERTPFLIEIVQLFDIIGYHIYLQPLSCFCPLDGSNSMIRNGLIVVPPGFSSSVDETASQEERESYLQHLHRVRNPFINITALSIEMCKNLITSSVAERLSMIDEKIHLFEFEKQESEVEIKRQNYYGLFQSNGFVKIMDGLNRSTETELDLLLPYNSPFRLCLLKEYLLQEETLTVYFPIDKRNRDKSYDALVNLECLLWVDELLDNSNNPLSRADCSISDELFQAERLSLFISCSRFLQERISTISSLFVRKWKEPVILYAPNISVSESSGNQTATPASVSYSVLRYYSDYDDDVSESPQSMDSWFEREPFESNYNHDYCGEPIFCNHGQEMLKRIKLWQFPARNQLEYNEMVGSDTFSSSFPSFLGESFSSPSFSSELTKYLFSANRTCEMVKYLIYEPPSDLHGIGSLLEVTAAAMRFAICLDRVLLLLPTNQSNTIRKWLPAGCHHNVFECYFQPVTRCAVSEEDIKNAPIVYATGSLDLSAYPWKKYRHLVYKGLPLDGPCRLCYSRWPKESSFWDGLYMTETEYNEKLYVHSLYSSTVYTEKIKLPWISHFLRILLRPRKWFSNALKEIIFHSMVSPTKNINGNSILSHQINTAASMDLKPTFPEFFLSLHVRFGMKRVEVALEPLSRYMKFIKKKFPFLKDIFLSTETEEVVQTLIRYVCLLLNFCLSYLLYSVYFI